jgi:uncharacterized membrane protein
VAIALFGGAAGAIGFTRREVSNVVPGVSIATALMPPLCTAGYGLATAHWAFMAGAFYLFCINAAFISLAMFLVARILPLPHFEFENRRQARRAKVLFWTVAVLTAVPSVWLAAGIVRRTTFEHNAQRFVDEELNLPGAYVVTRRIEAEKKAINVLLTGRVLTPAQLRAVRAQLETYHLGRAHLTVRQGLARLDSTRPMPTPCVAACWKTCAAATSKHWPATMPGWPSCSSSSPSKPPTAPSCPRPKPCCARCRPSTPPCASWA